MYDMKNVWSSELNEKLNMNQHVYPAGFLSLYLESWCKKHRNSRNNEDSIEEDSIEEGMLVLQFGHFANLIEAKSDRRK